MRLFFSLALLIGLGSGCAVNPTKVQANLAGRSVGISVCLKDQLSNQWIGTTIFNNSAKEQPAPGLGLTEAAKLASQEYFQLTDSKVTILADCLDWKTAPRPPLGTPVLLTFHEGYVPDQIGGTNRGQSGIGVFQRSLLGVKPFGRTHAVLEAKLADTFSGKQLGKTDCFVLGSSILLDDSVLLSTEALAQNSAQFRELTKFSVRRCLIDLGFETAN